MRPSSRERGALALALALVLAGCLPEHRVDGAAGAVDAFACIGWCVLWHVREGLEEPRGDRGADAGELLDDPEPDRDGAGAERADPTD